MRDLISNASGSLIVVGNELLFDQQLIKYKFSFWDSPYRTQSNGYLGNTALEGIFYDYNGHSYWFSTPIRALVSTDKIPHWLCFSVGYSANGMFGEFKNMTSYRGVSIPETVRYRQYLLSLDIDWTKIPTNSKLMRKVLNTLVFIKLPFPTLEMSNSGRLKGYWLYY